MNGVPRKQNLNTHPFIYSVSKKFHKNGLYSRRYLQQNGGNIKRSVPCVNLCKKRVDANVIYVIIRLYGLGNLKINAVTGSTRIIRNPLLYPAELRAQRDY